MRPAEQIVLVIQPSIHYRLTRCAALQSSLLTLQQPCADVSAGAEPKHCLMGLPSMQEANKYEQPLLCHATSPACM